MCFPILMPYLFAYNLKIKFLVFHKGERKRERKREREKEREKEKEKEKEKRLREIHILKRETNASTINFSK